MPAGKAPLSLPFLDRLTTKITIAAVVFLFALAAGIVLLIESGFRRNQFGAFSSSQNVLLDQEEAALIDAVRVEADFLAAHLQAVNLTVRHSVSYLETGTGEGSLPEASLNAYLARVLAQNPDLSALAYFTEQGEVYGSSRGSLSAGSDSPKRLSAYSLAGPQKNPARTSIWLSPALAAVGPESELTVSAPVYRSGAFLGVVVAAVPLDHLTEHLEDLQIQPGGTALLVDSQGRLISTASMGQSNLPTSSPITGTSPTQAASLLDGNLKRALEQLAGQGASAETLTGAQTTAGAETIELTDGLSLIVSAPLQVPDWSLALVVPLEAITGQSKAAANTVWHSAEQTIRTTLLWVFVLFLAALLVALLALDRLFSRRVAMLIEGVRAVTAGDLAVIVPDQPRDELGILGGAFNGMSAEIRRRRMELLQANQDLEKRVAEGTREIKLLYEQTVSRSQELEVLYQADEQLYRHLRLEGVLQALVEVVVRRLKADKACVQVWDAARERLVVRAAHGFSPQTVSRLSDYRPGDGIAGRVFQTGEAMAVEDASQAPPPAGEIAAAEGIRSVLSIPITIDGQHFGVFGINYSLPRSFTSTDLRLLQALAQRAAIAIENARLYEQAEQAATLEERQRLARELHDAITQSLYSLVLLAEAGRRHAVAGNLEQVGHHLTRLGETAQQALKEMRLLVYELRPLALSEAGLAGAIRQRLDSVEKRAGIQARLFVEGSLELSPLIEEQLYRIIQEGLNNALKYAGARTIGVHLRSRPGFIEVDIRDDGQGFDPQEIGPGGIGLNSMRERARRLGAVLAIESQPGKGTALCLRLDLDEDAKAGLSKEMGI